MILIPRFRLSRRTVLRGAGVCLALPLLDAMLNESGTALAQGAPLPKRLGVFFWGNGVRPDRWRPSGGGTDWTPSEELMPLAHLKQSVSVLSGMEVKFDGTAHHRGRAGILCGAYDVNAGMYGQVSGPSIDQVAATAWDGQTPFRSIEVGISMRSKGGVNASRASGGTAWSGPNQRVPAEYSPMALFERLFGSQFNGDQTDEQAKRELMLQQSILDTITSDAKALTQRVGAVDKLRLEAHLDGIRQLEQALASADRACIKPDVSGDPAVDLGHEMLDERNELIAEIMSRALACDLTRAFSYEYTGMQADTIFWQIGATEGSHVMTHDDRNLPDMLEPQTEKVHQSVVFTMGHFAKLLDKLEAIVEGDGTLLDNSCIMACSEVNDGTVHTYDSMPLLIAGRAGGSLNSGVHYQADHENATKALLTCLRAVGLPLDSFGVAEGQVSESIGALEA